MPRKRPVLERIDNDRPITPGSDPAFYRALKLGLLLALKERGILSEMQYRSACEGLGETGGGK